MMHRVTAHSEFVKSWQAQIRSWASLLGISGLSGLQGHLRNVIEMGPCPWEHLVV